MVIEDNRGTGKKMCFTLVVLLMAIPPLVTSIVINAAQGCVYDVVPNENFKFTFKVAGNNVFEKDCPEKHVFDKTSCGCIPDTGPGSGSQFQTTVSSNSGIRSTTATPPVDTNCRFREIPNDEFGYLEQTNQGWKARPCGNGTKFQLTPACNCIHWDLVSPTCHPEVEIGSAEGKVKGYGSISRYDVTLTVNNVQVDDMGFDFDGSSEIRIDLFNNLDYTSGFTFSFEFNESSPIDGKRQILFTNCDNSTKNGSIEFALHSGYVSFAIDVGQDRLFARDVEYKPGGFKKVTAMYDGKKFTAYVDNKMGIIEKAGVIRKRPYPLIIGNSECPESYGFRGTLRRIKIYRCVKDDGSIIP